MNLKQAQDVAAEYGGFLEWAHSRLFTIFFSDIPESLLPHTSQYIEDSLNIVAENYHNHRDFEKVKLLQETIGTLIFYKDDEKAILQVLEFISEEKWRDLRWRDLTIEKIKDFRTKDQKHISSYFKEKPFEEIDFENLDYSTAYKMVDITSRYFKSAHMPLCYIFTFKTPESFLPFPKKQLINALDICAVNDKRYAREYISSKSLFDFYVDDENAIFQFITNFSDKSRRDSIISDIKNSRMDINNISNTKKIYHQDMADKIYNENPELAMQIALGKENPPTGILAAAVYAKVCNEVEKSEDIELCRRIANSIDNSNISAQSQKLKLREPFNPIEAMKEIVNERIKTIEKKLPWGKPFKQFYEEEVEKMGKYIIFLENCAQIIINSEKEIEIKIEQIETLTKQNLKKEQLLKEIWILRYTLLNFWFQNIFLPKNQNELTNNFAIINRIFQKVLDKNGKHDYLTWIMKGFNELLSTQKSTLFFNYKKIINQNFERVGKRIPVIAFECTGGRLAGEQYESVIKLIETTIENDIKNYNSCLLIKYFL